MKRGMIFVVFYDCVSDSLPGCGEEETMMMVMKHYVPLCSFKHSQEHIWIGSV